MRSKDYALMITGCVAPDNTVFSLKLIDSNERLDQYLDSLKYYITKTLAENIIFCDNSDFEYDYSEIYEIAKNNGKYIEIFRFKGNQQKVAECGKGYGEGEIIEYIIKKSELVKRVSYLYKITGRLIINNFDEIVCAEKKNDIYFNKNLYSYKSLDTRFWGVPKELFVDLFLEQYQKVKDSESRFIEYVYYDAIEKTVLEYKQHVFFPQIAGKSGTINSVYKETKPIYSKCLSGVAKRGIFNNDLVYTCMFLFMHWDRCLRVFLGLIKAKGYHYYAEVKVRIKNIYMLFRAFICRLFFRKKDDV